MEDFGQDPVSLRPVLGLPEATTYARCQHAPQSTPDRPVSQSCRKREGVEKAHLDHVIWEFVRLNEAVSIFCGLGNSKAAKLSVPGQISDD